MELKIFRDTLCSMGPACEAKAELPIEAEILIPDYLPQIFKIVKCLVHLVTLQKQVSQGRITAEGYLRCVVYYEAEDDQSLCQTEQKIPFTRTMELPQGEYGACQIQVGGQVEYLNCRAVNQRRVDVRGAFGLTARITPQVQQEVITALAECGIEQKMCSISTARSLVSLDKLITAEETLALGETPQAVLEATGVGTVEEIKLVSGKAVVKGSIQMELVYRTSAGDGLQTARQAVPFNQILDIDQVPEDSQCFAYAEMTGCTLMAAAGAEEGIGITVTALLHLRIWRSGEHYLVEDAFSTQYHTQLEQQPVYSEQLQEQLHQSTAVQVEGSLPDEDAQLLHCFVLPQSLELVQKDQQLVFSGRAWAHILCRNSLGELDCYDKLFEYQFPQQFGGQPEDYRFECWPSVASVQVEKEAGQAMVKAQMELNGLVFARCRQNVLGQVECTSPLESTEADIALRIYYAKAGEEVFAIAKQYHVPAAELVRANQLEEQTLQAPARLLVPSTV